jgi:hypothetical protein
MESEMKNAAGGAKGMRGVVLAGVMLALGLVSGVEAATQRTFVASTGSDANAATNCALAAPCRTFGVAISVTNAGGEVIVLDSAGYGPVTVGQAVSIIAPPGVYAGLSVASGTGVTVNAAGAKVTLRGLTINAQGGATGVVLQAAAALYLDNVIVTGFTVAGLSAAVGADSAVFITDSVFRDNVVGVKFNATAGTLTASVERSQFERNGTGASFADGVVGTVRGASFTGGGAGIAAAPVTAAKTAKVEVRDSTVADNSGVGVQAGGGAGTATLTLVSSLVSGNATGVLGTGTGNTAYVSDATITRNATGVSAAASGTVPTFGDNRLMNNTSNGAFSGAPLAKQ